MTPSLLALLVGAGCTAAHVLVTLVLLRVPGHRPPDLVRGQVAPGGQEAYDKAEQPLGLALRHGPSKPLRWLQAIVSQGVLCWPLVGCHG